MHRVSSSSDTICAIATGAGVGAIGVLRISGPRAAEIAARLVRPWPMAPESHRLYLGEIFHPTTDEPLDEALACLMRGPRSYTGEDVVELQVHGGQANMARLIEAVVAAGARPAAAGEFTRRAVLSGRIDLSRAEAIAGVIAAHSERAVRLAQAQRRGAVGDAVERLSGRLVELLAEVEGAIDFPEEDLRFLPPTVIGDAIFRLSKEMRALAETYAQGRRIAEGITVVLAGRTNAGKSSLLNALVGSERALVDEAPGTTRDVVTAEVAIDGMRVRLVDTAGERAVDDAESVERRGIELGRRWRADADVVVLVVDGSVGFGEAERRLLDERTASIVVWNKRDLAPRPEVPSGVAVVSTAAPSGEGIDALRWAIRDAAGDGGDGEIAISSARQKALLDEGVEALNAAMTALGGGAPLELIAVDLRAALHRCEGVIGRGIESSVLDAVFARFCIGK